MSIVIMKIYIISLTLLICGIYYRIYQYHKKKYKGYYRNSGYNPKGLFQNKDESGYIVLENLDGEKVEIDLPTAKEVEKVASELGLDIQKSDF